jgi:hypothetical protein
MGKRSGFERREADFYPTPRAAVAPLVPFLRGTRTFAEPCCGDGDLIRHLESFGLRCVYAGDIRQGQDALAVKSYGGDAIITNPPFRRDWLMPMIEHFRVIAPTWLLNPADWSHTKYAASVMPTCSDIVSIGRVKWIDGSKHTGKDNFAWYRFHSGHAGGPVFHGRDLPTPARCRACERCSKSYEPERATGRFCSAACRQSAYRKRHSVTLGVTQAGAAT